MERKSWPEHTVAGIDLEGCEEGVFAEPFENDCRSGRHFPGWEAVSITTGNCTKRVSDGGWRIVCDRDEPVLEITAEYYSRTLLALDEDARDGRIVAELRPIAGAMDRELLDGPGRREAITGIIFRYRTPRHFYLFAIEGRRRAVLYRRRDSEWIVLNEQEVEPGEDYLSMEVSLDGDGIRCRCASLGVEFFATDTMHHAGKLGVTAAGQGRIRSARVMQNISQRARHAAARGRRTRRLDRLGRDIPDAELTRTIDLGGARSVTFADFAEAGRNDMIFTGRKLLARTADGRLLWEQDIAAERVQLSTGRTGNGRLIYACTGVRRKLADPPHPGMRFEPRELCVIAGRTGEVLARAPVPQADNAGAFGIQYLTGATANLTGNGPFDIILRDNDGPNLRAYDRELNLLWHQQVQRPYHGHYGAVRFFDVDGDGRDEVLAGGRLFSGDGKLLWEHDLAHQVHPAHPDEHYDDVVIGRFAEDDSIDPVAVAAAGHPGVFVIDALTGRTRMHHRIGHAQDICVGRFRNDLPGRQILIGNRWQCFTTLTLLSGAGDILWQINPDHHYHAGPFPVDWPGREHQLIWVCSSADTQALFDGSGRRVRDLPAIRAAWNGYNPWEVSLSARRIGHDRYSSLCLTAGGIMHVFQPA